MRDAIAQLRHLYSQMCQSPDRSQHHTARGLLGPAIERLEVSEEEFQQLRTAFAENVPPNDALRAAWQRHK